MVLFPNVCWDFRFVTASRVCVAVFPGLCRTVSGSVLRCFRVCVAVFPGLCGGVSGSVSLCFRVCVGVFPSVCCGVSESVLRCFCSDPFPLIC